MSFQELCQTTVVFSWAQNGKQKSVWGSHLKNQQQPPRDGQLKLPISLPIGCSGFDWFVINSSYWPVEQDGWRHVFVLLTHYPTELGLGGEAADINTGPCSYWALLLNTHTHRHTQCLTHTESLIHKHTHTQTFLLTALGWSRIRRNLNRLRRCWRQTKTTTLVFRDSDLLCVRVCICLCEKKIEKIVRDTSARSVRRGQKTKRHVSNFSPRFLRPSLSLQHCEDLVCVCQQV